MIIMTSRFTGQSSVSSSVCADYEQKTWKVHVTISLWGKPPVSGAFPAQMDSNAGIVPFDDVIMSPSHDDAITRNHILYYGLVWGETTADCCFPVCLWWHHPMETLSALLCLLGGQQPVSDAFPLQPISNPELKWCRWWQYQQCVVELSVIWDVMMTLERLHCNGWLGPNRRIME